MSQEDLALSQGAWALLHPACLSVVLGSVGFICHLHAQEPWEAAP